MRKEEDSIGIREIEGGELTGIHTLRSRENFDITGRSVHHELILGMLEVKKACAMANVKIGLLEKDVAEAIVVASDEYILGVHDEELWQVFRIDALQGGAGTSTNMNVNEVLANRALMLIHRKPGDYESIHPLNHVNMSQSTNDVYPTALRIAAIRLVRELSDELAALQETLQQKENAFGGILKLGRTELMDAVPMTVGQAFGAYARAISRDRWRIYKVEERLREINLGGTAIGTGLNAPPLYTYRVTEILQQNTRLGLCRSDYLMDTTQNMDVFVEVSGLLKALSVNLIKIANDLRLLSSGPSGGLSELKLPEQQAGSSIMPGKINPVICEMTVQAALRVIGHDACITQASYLGQLELNAFAPLIADSLIDSLKILKLCTKNFRDKCIEGITVNEENCMKHLEGSVAMATALIHHIGYDEATRIAKLAMNSGKTVKEVAMELNLLSNEELDRILGVYSVTAPGIPGKEKI